MENFIAYRVHGQRFDSCLELHSLKLNFSSASEKTRELLHKPSLSV